MDLTNSEEQASRLDHDKALEVAYASKEERCLAAAGRAVDTALESLENADGYPSFSPETELEVANKLIAIHNVYPEAFKFVVKECEKPSSRLMFSIIPVINRYGGLPLKEDGNGTKSKVGAEELDSRAELRERIAEALYDTPPSQDFLEENKLTDITYKHSNKKPVDVVLDLLESVDYNKKLAKKAKDKTVWDLGFYEDNNRRSSSKATTIISWVENTSTELELHLKNVVFKEEVTAALNDEESTLASLKELWLKGRALVQAGYTDKAERKQQMFDAILNGEAHVYTKQS